MEIDHFGNRTIFTVELDHEITYEEAIQIQREAGYHPAGYGGPSEPRLVEKREDKFVYRFSCSSSCD